MSNARSSLEHYEEYQKRKNRFISFLPGRAAELAVGGRWNQVAKATLSLERLSVILATGER